ncbi:hypothetical protein E2562_009109 [Oryza meyeriana var. granulata]|uniref:F-box/LRR-repeat protein 15/At3g58940/PEG3-like LRR domain-containing protein n=1 Tax=Oryza meyeriana var. granulata TaxID=110450 RepID=A0A6G1D100_9ORYZ|nr:hypothetical protein E2562_009104 [Oryza meyeriana var. granulata]KAF0906111.1 hypothetical protein E2562_009109 [Oryza meyeriana var. granulata]
MDDRDLPLLLAASPVLEILAVFGILGTMQARLSSRSLRCAQFCLSFMGEVDVLDAPHLEQLSLEKLYQHKGQDWPCSSAAYTGLLAAGSARAGDR